MKKITTLLIFLAMAYSAIPALGQEFDTTAYKEHYKQRFDSYYYTGNYSTEDKVAGLSKAWAEAKYGFANFDLVPQLNWDSLYHAYIPKVMESPNPVAYYKVMMNFYQHLHDGHSSIFPPKSLWEEMFSVVPVRCQMMEDEVVITDVYSDDYPMLKVGQVIRSINGQTVKEYASSNISPYMSFSTPQDSISRLLAYMLFTGDLRQPIDLELVQPDGQIKRETIFRQNNEGFFNARGDFHFEVLDGNVGYLKIPTFNNPEILTYYEKVMPEIMKTDALIIDIRKNGGGNGNYGHELIGYLTDKPFYQGINVLRQYTPTHRAWGVSPDELRITDYEWKPYKGIHYVKPVTVLIGPSTYSAAEDFLVAFKSIERGMLIGQTTGGSTGQPLFFKLPNEGMGFVCTKRDMMTNGMEFVGKGIQPDIWVNYSLRNYLQGKDEAKEKALELLKVKKIKNKE